MLIRGWLVEHGVEEARFKGDPSEVGVEVLGASWLGQLASIILQCNVLDPGVDGDGHWLFGLLGHDGDCGAVGCLVEGLHYGLEVAESDACEALHHKEVFDPF